MTQEHIHTLPLSYSFFGFFLDRRVASVQQPWTMTLWKLTDVADFLQCGPRGAENWLARKGVSPVVDLGPGRGMGRRWRKSDVEAAVLAGGKAESPRAEPSAALAREHQRAMALFAPGAGRKQ